MLGQDDPRKCTAARMARLGLARPVRRVPARAVVLDPFAARTLLPSDARRAAPVAAIDCSWRLAGGEFARGFGGEPRRLPPLLAGNPVNYSRLGVLTTAEALAAALFITGSPGEAGRILAAFRWGHTFHELNAGLLGDYSRMSSESEVPGILGEYGIAA